jgi:hypothetical protein
MMAALTIRLDSSLNLRRLEDCLNPKVRGVRVPFGIRASIDGRTVRAEAKIEFADIDKFRIGHF